MKSVFEMLDGDLCPHEGCFGTLRIHEESTDLWPMFVCSSAGHFFEPEGVTPFMFDAYCVNKCMELECQVERPEDCPIAPIVIEDWARTP